MEKIKKGDIVGRISYGKDILFVVERIIRTSNKKTFAILKGLTLRIEADSPIEDLQIIEKTLVQSNMRSLDDRLDKRIQEGVKYDTSNFSILKKGLLKRGQEDRVVYNGRILHLDGDKKYSSKSMKYYKELGLNAIVKNIPERSQSIMVYNLLNKYKPDILVITRA